jgi:broad specificity phosphatase PhoE
MKTAKRRTYSMRLVGLRANTEGIGRSSSMTDSSNGLAAERFVFVRHGETDWNERGVFQGRSDIPLNETGLAQAREAARQIIGARPDRIVSSPLQRAHQTAKLIAEATDQKLWIEPNLIECDFGSLEGVSIKDEMARNSITRKEQLADILPPDAEQWPQLCSRSLETVRHWLAISEGRTVAFVGHDAFLQSLAETLCGAWFSAAHGVPYEFNLVGGSWRVQPY